jgi:hypothetical protein
MCLNSEGYQVFNSVLDVGRMDVFETALWAIQIARVKCIGGTKAQQVHVVIALVIFSDL